MTNLTIRMDPAEKDRLMAWAASKGTSATDYIKQLVAADMAAATPEDRAAAWFREHEAEILEEATRIKDNGIPGSSLALHYPWPDE